MIYHRRVFASLAVIPCWETSVPCLQTRQTPRRAPPHCEERAVVNCYWLNLLLPTPVVFHVCHLSSVMKTGIDWRSIREHLGAFCETTTAAFHCNC